MRGRSCMMHPFGGSVMSLRLSLAVAVLVVTSSLAAGDADRLTSRALPASPADKVLAAGDKLLTRSGEQKRIRLPDRSLVYVRQGTSLAVKKDGSLEVSAGEVFVETAAGKLAPSLSVHTPKRT